MARAVPVPISQLPRNALGECYAVLRERVAGTTRDGKPYFTCRFADRSVELVAKIWADSRTFGDCNTLWQAGTCYRLTGVVSDHPSYGPQLDIHKARPVAESDRAEGFDPGDYEVRSRLDSAETFARLVELALAEVAHAGLRRLTLELLQAHRDTVLNLPASLKQFYPFPGGWLEHVLHVAQTCISLCDYYQKMYVGTGFALNRDVVICAALLHDLGRAEEWHPATAVGVPPEPTVAGQLHGHLVLGRDLVRDAARGVPELDAETLLLLEHVVLTHLSLPAWGSPRLPLAPESVLLHHADDLSAKLEMYARALTLDSADGDFTERDPALGKALWKTRPVG